MARAAFTTSYDDEGPIKRNNEECNEFFYEKRRREILGDREDSEELFRRANPTLNLPVSPGGPMLPQSPVPRTRKFETDQETTHGIQAGAVALYQIPKLYAGDIDQPRRLLNLPPVPEEQLKQYLFIVTFRFHCISTSCNKICFPLRDLFLHRHSKCLFLIISGMLNWFPGS
jgi:hypothetical protein